MSLPDSVPEIGHILPRAELPGSPCGDGVLWGPPPDTVRTESHRTPWWLWWNVLSIDAPTVAVVWATVLAHASGRQLSAAEATIMVLAVWVIYASDRLLDGWTAKNRAALQERHHFCERHRFVLAGLVLLVSAAIVWLVTYHLQDAGVTAGVKLGVILVLYMASIHVGRRGVAWVLPKEIVVGLLFASGVTLPLCHDAYDFPGKYVFRGCSSVSCVRLIVCRLSVGRTIIAAERGDSHHTPLSTGLTRASLALRQL